MPVESLLLYGFGSLCFHVEGTGHQLILYVWAGIGISYFHSFIYFF